MCRAHPHVRDRKQWKCDGPLKISHPRASKNPDFYQRLFFSLSVSESLSRNAGCDIECTLLGILKRLRASSRRIIWRARIQWELSICLDIYLP